MADARRMGKSELFAHFAERFELKRTQAREFFEYLERRRLRFRLGCPADRLGAHPELVEQHVPQLRCRADVELLARELPELYAVLRGRWL